MSRHASIAWSARRRRLECDDADECHLSGTGRSPRRHSDIPAAGRAIAAARTDAAQHFRAALSRHDRRRAAVGPPPDRHDPAGQHVGGIRRQAAPLQGRLRRPPHPVHRERRRPLSDPAHRRRPLPHRGRAHGDDAIPAMPRALPARARTRSIARACCMRSPISSRPTTSRPTGMGSRTRPTRPWSTRWR
jgi:hypothetical protein